MHDALYERQGQLAASHLAGYAKALRLNVEQFDRDRQQAAVSARVEADLESGARSGVKGTPSFFANGSKYDGDWQGPGLLHRRQSQL
ncbi:DsbA family protein [uncultured Hymenobacter sp.]|uniref:DsbA family protein n=1 Tax=uncultured Hymenobacter sp. TaxID=170016 RepID=UPI0035C9EFCB